MTPSEELKYLKDLLAFCYQSCGIDIKKDTKDLVS